MNNYSETYGKNRKHLFTLALKNKLNYTDEDIEICIGVLTSNEKKILNKRKKEMIGMNQQQKNNRIYKIICIIIDTSKN
ncbi:MAG: hypothetical protein QM490_02620 [Candidatus Gracilibacteria bacterium]